MVHTFPALQKEPENRDSIRLHTLCLHLCQLRSDLPAAWQKRMGVLW
jgi:hypothetical protein